MQLGWIKRVAGRRWTCDLISFILLFRELFIYCFITQCRQTQNAQQHCWQSCPRLPIPEFFGVRITWHESVKEIRDPVTHSNVFKYLFTKAKVKIILTGKNTWNSIFLVREKINKQNHKPLLKDQFFVLFIWIKCSSASSVCSSSRFEIYGVSTLAKNNSIFLFIYLFLPILLLVLILKERKCCSFLSRYDKATKLNNMSDLINIRPTAMTANGYKLTSVVSPNFRLSWKPGDASPARKAFDNLGSMGKPCAMATLMNLGIK